ncbi:indolepyruvate ferredoxin oxidoreductase family protein [Azoarcus sp. L1K30]|uniref:indolepyruvate ferredoxin oxidoreductase family protein n=1 Tax=Azoarcus sp. L1K30 TaxID=2820277 RepID=UPI001B831E48|nr:indolepyruvate ferredoxin oxidoreductase family protein [Azoarcus sp. L1K30]MBR0566249.1 indolepyruvate ferredoxin oxidoreductase family protein [Azoarcus sp. L1K30]
MNTPTIQATPSVAVVNHDYRLADNLEADRGQVFLTGTQALVRLPLMQAMLDRAAGLNTGGFISGYRGSPLGAYDQQLWKVKSLLEDRQIRFLPAVNEELGATAVLGSQQVEGDAERMVDGVFAIWYGKGPGVDRAGDALRHGNAYGASPHGGVLAVIGDDHGCVSSSMPHQSDFTLQAWSLPVLNPASVAEMIEFGLYGWALSRFSGCWVGLKAISETVESGSTVDLDAIRTRFDAPTDYTAPAGGLHYRWPDLPSLVIEQRLAAKLDAARHFARHNSIDRLLCPATAADVGIVTCGKAHLDLLEALRRLGLGLTDLETHGIRLYKVGQSFPLEQGRMRAFARGLKEILVVEEKGPFVEQQIKNLFYNDDPAQRPQVFGKTAQCGAPLLPALGEMRPSRVMPVLADWLAGHRPALDRRALVEDFTAPMLLANVADGVRRVPYFCSGCPHNTSTRVPEGSHAQAGIGCHFMASWMPDRETTGLIQMGGEGVDWVAHSGFTRTPHVFQNLGDGTYFHSGFLAIRQAIAAHTNVTYKILYNDAVAMTGGQPVDGTVTVDGIARQVEAEGARRVVVVSDAPEKYDGHEGLFPRGTTFHHRSELDAVQRELREVKGVSVLIYDQTCAAEKRRRRKKRAYPDPDRRLFINAAVCEGCGDCGKQSNCLSIVPLDTPLGRKRMIDQSSCNKDYSCVEGFCPSFVSVMGGKVRKAVGAALDQPRLQARMAALAMPATHEWTGPYDLLVTGVGGTGVVTVGALVTMAAHLEGKSASVLDFMGFAQKGGQVLSFVRIATDPGALNQVRIDTQQADAVIACDLVVGASNDALQTIKHGRTRVVANLHEIQTARFVQDPEADLHVDALLEKIRYAAGGEQLSTCDAQALSLRVLGDTIGANIVLLGFSWQLGMVPVSLEALTRAIELNAVAVPTNLTAFSLGRLAATDPRGLAELVGSAPETGTDVADEHGESLRAVIDAGVERLTAYQNAAYADGYRALLREVELAERGVVGEAGALHLSRVVARVYARLLAVKDEYEVARLFTDGQFDAALARQFEGDFSLQFHMAPPLLSRPGPDGRPRKLTFGPRLMPVLRLLARGKVLRGTVLDLFGRSDERRMERELAADYARTIRALLPRLSSTNLGKAVELAGLAEGIRGFGPVKLANLRRIKQQERSLVHALGLDFVAGPTVSKLCETPRGRAALQAISVVKAP